MVATNLNDQYQLGAFSPNLLLTKFDGWTYYNKYSVKCQLSGYVFIARVLPHRNIA